jgi:Putative ParB-like nuclease
MVVVSGTSLERVKIADLRPTQMTLGYREVERKQKKLSEAPQEGWRQIQRASHDPGCSRTQGTLLHRRPPSSCARDARGRGRGHSRRRAGEIEYAGEVPVLGLSRQSLLAASVRRGWTRRDYHEIPKSIAEMKDDPYRSVAGELSRAGGFAKDASAVHGIPVGGCAASAHRARTDPERLRPRHGAGAEIRAQLGSRLFARLERSERLMLGEHAGASARAARGRLHVQQTIGKK